MSKYEPGHCIACGEVAVEGFALGKLCYHCIERTVIGYIKIEKEVAQEIELDLDDIDWEE